MNNKVKTTPVVLFITLLLLCCGNNKPIKKNIPPPPPPDNRCSTMKANAYQYLLSGDIEILFNDTFNSNNWSMKRHYLDSILKYHFNLIHTPLFNDDYKNCIQPIMDSAIIAEYGIKGKDSIINEAYKLTDIVYKKENKE